MKAVDLEREPFQLGDWRVDAPGNRLQRGEELRPLRHKAMALLVLLARHAGQTVPREQIVAEIWAGNQWVANKAINNAVWTIRQTLGDDPESPRYLQTIAKKGYRLIAEVRPIAPAPGPVPGASPPPATAAPGPAATPLAWLGGALLLALIAWGAAWAWRTQLATPRAPGLPALLQAEALTQLPGIEYLGQVSPDGRWLAFAWWQGSGAGRLHLRPRHDMQAPPQLASGDAGDVHGLAWSPDSSALAFAASTADGRCTLWHLDRATLQSRALAACVPMATPTVDWSPDGRWITFSASAEGSAGLFLVAPDGSGLRRLTVTPPGLMPDHQPAWSPDARRVAFAREDGADNTRDLYETTLDGSVARLSTLRLRALHGLTYAADGQDLVFSTTRQDTRVLLRWQRAGGQVLPLGLDGSAPQRSADGRITHALMRTHVSIARLEAGGGLQRLIQSVASDRAPDFHAASGRTVFVSRRSGHPELWVDEGQGTPPRQLTRLENAVAAPAWSPSGQQVAFIGHCGPGGRVGLCVINSSGGAPRRLDLDAGNFGRPAWHPDGNSVWLGSDRGGNGQVWQIWQVPAEGGAAGAHRTEAPPGRALQWLADGRALVYQVRGRPELRLWAPGGGAERPLQALPATEALVDWRLQGRSVLALTRGEAEALRRFDIDSGRLQLLARHPLGTFPELATLAPVAGDAVLVEVANASGADLMQTR